MTTLIGVGFFLGGAACLIAANAVFLGLYTTTAGLSGWVVLAVAAAGLVSSLMILNPRRSSIMDYLVRFTVAGQAFAGMGAFAVYALSGSLPSLQIVPMAGLTLLALFFAVSAESHN